MDLANKEAQSKHSFYPFAARPRPLKRRESSHRHSRPLLSPPGNLHAGKSITHFHLFTFYRHSHTAHFSQRSSLIHLHSSPAASLYDLLLNLNLCLFCVSFSMAQERDQKHARCEQPEPPLLCANNCGFFGCPATMNLCSECFRELSLKEESPVSTKALGEKNPIMLSDLVEKSLSKGPLSACAPVADAPHGVLVSVSSLQSSTDHLLSKAEATPASGAADVLKPAEPFQDTTEAQLEPLVAVSPSIPVAVQHVQSSGSTRCISCRKRVGLLGFKCRCGGVFCAAHRYSDKHDCSFDYKAAGRDAIAKANPVVKAEKVEKI